MPYRKVNFTTGEIYHIYNRGVDQRVTFQDKRDFKRFLDIMGYYSRERSIRYSLLPKRKLEEKSPELVEIICFCLMPNHFHLLIRQKGDIGVSKFLRLIQNSYTKYFNTKYKRNGHLFQGTFKAVHISTDEQLVHVSRYIHLNPLVAGLVNSPKSYKWSSLRYYLKGTDQVSSSIVLAFFRKTEDYEEFIKDYADYAKVLEKIKHEVIDI